MLWLRKSIFPIPARQQLWLKWRGWLSSKNRSWDSTQALRLGRHPIIQGVLTGVAARVATSSAMRGGDIGVLVLIDRVDLHGMQPCHKPMAAELQPGWSRILYILNPWQRSAAPRTLHYTTAQYAGGSDPSTFLRRLLINPYCHLSSPQNVLNFSTITSQPVAKYLPYYLF